nr:MAG TPA: hypothetical protein [Caudoviricetes sp.]
MTYNAHRYIIKTVKETNHTAPDRGGGTEEENGIFSK